MSVIAKLLSFGVARGLAALLAVLLSAVGGGRLGVERLTPELADEDRSPVTCPVGTTSRSTGQAVVRTDARQTTNVSHWVVAQVVALGVTCDHLSAPSLLIGSAGGPRAP